MDGDEHAPPEASIDLLAVEADLEAVEGALSAIESGDYGRCATCGSPIDETILAADPLARTCGEHRILPQSASVSVAEAD